MTKLGQHWRELALLLLIVVALCSVLLIVYLSKQPCKLLADKPIANPWESPLIVSHDRQSIGRISGYFELDNKLEPELRFMPLGELAEVTFSVSSDFGQVLELRTQCARLRLQMDQFEARLECTQMIVTTTKQADKLPDCQVDKPKIGSDIGKHYICMESQEYFCSGQQTTSSLEANQSRPELQIKRLIITYLEFVADQELHESGAPKTPHEHCKSGASRRLFVA